MDYRDLVIITSINIREQFLMKNEDIINNNNKIMNLLKTIADIPNK